MPIGMLVTGFQGTAQSIYENAIFVFVLRSAILLMQIFKDFGVK